LSRPDAGAPDFLQAHDIEFDRWSDGVYEYAPEVVTFRKGGDLCLGSHLCLARV
jgi:hypothetical protein